MTQYSLTKWTYNVAEIANTWKTLVDAIDWCFLNEPETMYDHEQLLRLIKKYATHIFPRDDSVTRQARRLLQTRRDRYNPDPRRLELKRLSGRHVLAALGYGGEK